MLEGFKIIGKNFILTFLKICKKDEPASQIRSLSKLPSLNQCQGDLGRLLDMKTTARTNLQETESIVDFQKLKAKSKNSSKIK